MASADIEIEIVPRVGRVFAPPGVPYTSRLMGGLDIIESELVPENEMLQDMQNDRIFMHPQTFKRLQRRLQIMSDVREIIKRELAPEIEWLKTSGHNVWADPKECCRG